MITFLIILQIIAIAIALVSLVMEHYVAEILMFISILATSAITLALLVCMAAKPTPLDVYKGRTELKIDFVYDNNENKNIIRRDSTVVFTEKYLESLKNK